MTTEYRLFEDRYIDVDTVRTRYWQAGEAGPPVILVHGLGGYIECWVTLFEFLAQTHRVYALDLIGFGRTDKPDGSYTFPFFARFVQCFMDRLKIENATLIGWSHGGGTVLQLAVNVPERLDKLVLIASGGLSTKMGFPLRALTVPLLGELLVSPSKKGSYRSLAYQMFDPGIVQEQWVDLHHTMSQIPGVSRSILKTLRTGATLFGGKSKSINPIVRGLHRVSAPTLLVWGRQDPLIPFACAAVARDRLPRSELLAIDRCGHAPTLEYPDLARKAIIKFLDR